MKLAYVAFDKSGRQVADTIDASSVADATESLRRQGLYVTRIAAGRAPEAHAVPRKAARRGSSRRLKNLAMFTRQLQVLVSSGTPLVQALAALERQTKEGPWRQAIAGTRSRVEEGASLADALEGQKDYFDPVCRSLVAAGESSGQLAPMLERLAVMARKRLHTRSALIGAIIYPCLLLGVALSVLMLLLVVVIPRFGTLFETLDAPLPATTQLLLSASRLFQSYWWAGLIVLVAAGAGARMWWKSPAGKRTLDGIVLRLPQFGQLVRNFLTARISRLLGVLLDSHVPVLEALELTGQSVGNSHYAALISKAQQAVSRGQPISSAFRDTELISPSVYEAIHNGEQSGQVGSLLLNIADFLDEENEVVVRSLTSILEPVILVLMGLLVGGVAMGLFTPLFDLTAITRGGG